MARHKAAHLSPVLIGVHWEHKREAGAISVLAALQDLVMRAERILAETERSSNVHQVLGAIRELRAPLETLGRGTGELKPDGQALAVNVLRVPEIQHYLAVVRDVVGTERSDLLPVVAERLALPDSREWTARANETALAARGVVLRKTSDGRTAPVVNRSPHP